MRSSGKLIIAAGFVGASIIAAAELTRRSRGWSEPPPPARQPAPAETSEAAAEPEPSPQPSRPEKRYQTIADRNVFRPLVLPPKESQEPEAPELEAADQPAAPPGERGRASATSPTGKPDPMAGLALTGITQVGERLRALLEHVPTRVGRYVSVGDEFHGFRVVDIRGDSVVLGKDGQQHTLSMGARRLSPETQGTAEPTAKKVEGIHAPTSPRPLAPTGPPAGMREGFGEEMLSWAESMSLPELERVYSQYGDYLSPQQRGQAEAYLQQRRARGR
jgi:hypothetical protein